MTEKHGAAAPRPAGLSVPGKNPRAGASLPSACPTSDKLETGCAQLHAFIVVTTVAEVGMFGVAGGRERRHTEKVARGPKFSPDLTDVVL